MKFSEQWLREYVDPPVATDVLVEQLTMAGLEVDGVEPVAATFTDVVVGEVLSVTQHPDADKLVVCSVSNGTQTLQVVCGAPNARAGIKVPFAQVGAVFPDLKIKKAKLRGVESFGMLCSERELGISDSHEGLMELPAEAPVGVDIKDYLSLDDQIIEVDLTPNRSDCLSILGIARETGLMNGLDVESFAGQVVAPVIEDSFAVELEAAAACPRFVGRVIRGINQGAQSPLWIQEKLRRAGLRSIDPVVDVTNYVMLELGQPLHAYDLAKLSGKIVVRQAEAGEMLTLLDESEIETLENTLLITDSSGPIGMAGVMGGLSTAVTESTVDVFLEGAFFAPTAIAGRARSYGMSTDAAHRFERGVDWQGQSRAVERATELLLQIAGGTPGPTVETVNKEQLPDTRMVSLRLSRVSRLLGVEIETALIDDLLMRLGFESERSVTEDDTVWTVTAPSYRFDIEIEADLIEEISRVFGYNNLPARTPATSLKMAPNSETSLTLNRVRDQLVAREYFEAVTYSFVDSTLQAKLDPGQEPIGLANPLSSEMSVMRTTIWVGLLNSLIYNVNRQQQRVRLFETGLCFSQPPNQSALNFGDISQVKKIAGVACGARQELSWSNDSQAIDFYDVKGDVESLFVLSGDPGSFSFETSAHPALHPGQSAVIKRNNEEVGYIGLLDPRVRAELGLRQPVYLFEISIDALMTKKIAEHRAMSRFPEVRRDIAVVVDAATQASDLFQCIRDAADDTLQNLKLFDVYQGQGIEPDRKSLALGLTFQHASRTLTDDEINNSIERIVASLEDAFGASLRN